MERRKEEGKKKGTEGRKEEGRTKEERNGGKEGRKEEGKEGWKEEGRKIWWESQQRDSVWGVGWWHERVAVNVVPSNKGDIIGALFYRVAQHQHYILHYLAMKPKTGQSKLFADALGCNDLASLKECASKKSISEIILAQVRVKSSMMLSPFAPVVDGHFLKVVKKIQNPIPVCNIPVCNIPVCNIPVCNIPVCNIPVCNIPVCNIPVCNIPVCNIPVCNIPVCNIPVCNIPVCNIPVFNIPVCNIPVCKMKGIYVQFEMECNKLKQY
ncbi:hypothetical protein QZH41_009231 [Actinostola sp. cb2023]|nr:hypothetical protein QZH41_009231 [Actinostola sp. cb2023]